MADARVDKDQVTAIYDRIAPLYDLWAWLTESSARDRCLELATIKDGERVLEVAVGTGLAFTKILQANPTGHNEGIDLTESMLARAHGKAEKSGRANFRLSVGDAYDLQFPDDSFDLVINNYMFDLLPQQDFTVVLGEFRRVLRPGGRLAMVNMTTGQRWYNNIWERIYRINPALLGGCRSVELRKYLEISGFIQIKREFMSQMTFPSEVIHATEPAPASSACVTL